MKLKPFVRRATHRTDVPPPPELEARSLDDQTFTVVSDKGETDDSDEVCESLSTARAMAMPTAVVCMISLTMLAVTYTLHFSKPVMLPIMAAFLLNLLFSPVVKAMSRFGLPNAFSAILVMGGAIGVIAFALSFTSAPAQELLAHKDKNLAILKQKLSTLRQPVAGLMEVSNEIDNFSSGEAKLSESPDSDKPSPDNAAAASAAEAASRSQSVVPVTVSQPSISSRIFSTTGDAAIGVSLMLVLLFYLLASGDRGLEKLVEIMPTFAKKRRVVELTHAIEKSISRYLLTTTAINFVLGLVIGIGMSVIGMPNPILWGVVAMLLNFLPFVGAIVGAGVVFLVAVVSFDSLAFAATAPAIYLTVNAIEANFVTPVLLGRSVSLHPVWLMVFFIIVGWVWGVGGAIVAVPLLAVIKITCDHVEPLMPIGSFLGR